MTKKYPILIFALFISLSCFAHVEGSHTQQTIVRNGIGLGSVIAVVLSWDRNKSIILAILHGIFSWLYVVYCAITRP